MSVQPAVAQPAVAEQTVTEPRHPALREHNKQRRAKFENRVADGITQFAGSIWVSQADSRVRSRENIRAARSALGIGSVVTSRSILPADSVAGQEVIGLAVLAGVACHL